MGGFLDAYLPVYDLALTEHLAVAADTAVAFRCARDLDFMTVRTPLLTASFFARGLPARLRGRAPEPPTQVRLAADAAVLPGWLLLGVDEGREVAFGAVGRFWQPEIAWRDVPREQFRSFDEPGWGKIACHFLTRPDGPGRSMVSYECRTATTDPQARRSMARYWWLVRPFVAHIMRATLSTIAADASAGRSSGGPAASTAHR